MSVVLKDDAVVIARLTWDASSTVDVDLQAVIVDNRGCIIDAAYYNNMKACGGKAVTHSGDEGGQAGGGGREEVRITLAQIPPNVNMILMLACCFTGGSLRQAPGAQVSFEQFRPAKRPLTGMPLAVSGCGLILGAFIRARSAGSWTLRPINQELPDARHFMDCLDDLNRHIVAEIPTANRRQKVAFAMEKGEVVDFGSSLRSVTLGLGWDVDQGKIDLDASAVLFDTSGQVLECVFFGNLKSSGSHSQPAAVEHSGDNLTGEGDGDDEQVIVRLDSIGGSVMEVFFCIHIYTKGRGGRAKTFQEVANPYCRVTNTHGGEELCRYTLTEAGDRSGLIIGRLRRSPDQRWGFHALGAPSAGTMYKDSIPDMQKISRTDPREQQRKALRSQTTTSLGSFTEAAPAGEPGPALVPVREAAGAPPHSKDCCALQ
jgi:tellurium resistance protein TerZ